MSELLNDATIYIVFLDVEIRLFQWRAKKKFCSFVKRTAVVRPRTPRTPAAVEELDVCFGTCAVMNHTSLVIGRDVATFSAGIFSHLAKGGKRKSQST
jgi:hypothetical protein